MTAISLFNKYLILNFIEFNAFKVQTSNCKYSMYTQPSLPCTECERQCTPTNRYCCIVILAVTACVKVRRYTYVLRKIPQHVRQAKYIGHIFSVLTS